VAVRSDTDFLAEHRPFVVRLCRFLLRDADEGEDAAQQAFLHAYRAVSEGVRPRQTRAWLAEIARNECRSRIRSAAAHPQSHLSEQLEAGTPDPADAAAEHELVEHLQEELAELPERQRKALLLREFRGLSYSEVAATMDATGPAIESLLQRARRRLVQRLIGPAFTLEWLRNVFARLVPPGGTAEVATAGGAALVVAKIAAISMSGAMAVAPAQQQVRSTPRVAHEAKLKAGVVHQAPLLVPEPVVRTVRTVRSAEHTDGGHHRNGKAPVPSTTSNSGSGTVDTPPPALTEGTSSPVAVDNSGPDMPQEAALELEDRSGSGSPNSGPGSSSSGHDDGLDAEADHSGHGSGSD